MKKNKQKLLVNNNLFASICKHNTQTGSGLSAGPTPVNPSNGYSLEYFDEPFF